MNETARVAGRSGSSHYTDSRRKVRDAIYVLKDSSSIHSAEILTRSRVKKGIVVREEVVTVRPSMHRKPSLDEIAWVRSYLMQIRAIT